MGIGAIAWFSLPTILGIAIRQTCEAQLSESCAARVRSLGHLLTYRGDLEGAEKWYAWAAHTGDKIAMFHLAWVNETIVLDDLKRRVEIGVRNGTDIRIPPLGPREETTVRMYRRSARAGFAPAMNNLGVLYMRGAAGLEEDPEEAFRWHLASAEAGNPIGALSVAVEYRFGIGTRKDRNAAARWLMFDPKAADRADLASPTLERTKSPWQRPVPPDMLRAMRNMPTDAPPFPMSTLEIMHPPTRPLREVKPGEMD